MGKTTKKALPEWWDYAPKEVESMEIDEYWFGNYQYHRRTKLPMLQAELFRSHGIDMLVKINFGSREQLPDAQKWIKDRESLIVYHGLGYLILCPKTTDREIIIKLRKCIAAKIDANGQLVEDLRSRSVYCREGNYDKVTKVVARYIIVKDDYLQRVLTELCGDTIDSDVTSVDGAAYICPKLFKSVTPEQYKDACVFRMVENMRPGICRGSIIVYHNKRLFDYFGGIDLILPESVVKGGFGHKHAAKDPAELIFGVLLKATKADQELNPAALLTLGCYTEEMLSKIWRSTVSLLQKDSLKRLLAEKLEESEDDSDDHARYVEAAEWLYKVGLPLESAMVTKALLKKVQRQALNSIMRGDSEGRSWPVAAEIKVRGKHDIPVIYAPVKKEFLAIAYREPFLLQAFRVRVRPLPKGFPLRGVMLIENAANFDADFDGDRIIVVSIENRVGQLLWNACASVEGKGLTKRFSAAKAKEAYPPQDETDAAVRIIWKAPVGAAAAMAVAIAMACIDGAVLVKKEDEDGKDGFVRDLINKKTAEKLLAYCIKLVQMTTDYTKKDTKDEIAAVCVAMARTLVSAKFPGYTKLFVGHEEYEYKEYPVFTDKKTGEKHCPAVEEQSRATAIAKKLWGVDLPIKTQYLYRTKWIVDEKKIRNLLTPVDIMKAFGNRDGSVFGNGLYRDWGALGEGITEKHKLIGQCGKPYTKRIKTFRRIPKVDLFNDPLGSIWNQVSEMIYTWSHSPENNLVLTLPHKLSIVQVGKAFRILDIHLSAVFDLLKAADMMASNYPGRYKTDLLKEKIRKIKVPCGHEITVSPKEFRAILLNNFLHSDNGMDFDSKCAALFAHAQSKRTSVLLTMAGEEVCERIRKMVAEVTANPPIIGEMTVYDKPLVLAYKNEGLLKAAKLVLKNPSIDRNTARQFFAVLSCLGCSVPISSKSGIATVDILGDLVEIKISTKDGALPDGTYMMCVTSFRDLDPRKGQNLMDVACYPER